ncbi:MAG: FixH family protein [Burkholderiales bacterium]
MTEQSVTANPAPWYSEPWPWILMAGPIAAIVAGIVTYALALNSENPMVPGNYYKEGLGINRVIEREQQARLLDYRTQLSFSSGETVRVLLRGIGQMPNELRLRLIHPTRGSRDHQVQLVLRGAGLYEGSLNQADMASSSKWYFHIEDSAGTWRIAGEWIPEYGNHANGN